MSQDIQLFNVGQHEWRFGVTGEGIPYAVAADVAKTFDYASTQKALQVIDADEKGSTDVVTPSGVQHMGVKERFLPESLTFALS